MQAGSEKAKIALWGKGYRVSQDSEEFQRWVPRRKAAVPGSLEAHLETFEGWPALLQQLYSASERDVALLRCALIRNREIMCCAFAKTEDRHRRPSVVAVAASAPVAWDEDVALTIARAHSLASRLASAYASNVKGNPEHVGTQLKNGTFVQDMEFELEHEPRNGDDWPEIIRAVKEWNGVGGIASPRLATLGANIIIGTQHEAEVMQSRAGIDGYYDARDRAIHPLTNKLTRWQPEPPASPVKQIAAQPEDSNVARSDDLSAINQSLQGIHRSIERMAQSMFEYMQRMNDAVFGDNKRRRR